MRRIRSHLSFANIAAGLALVIALGTGTTYAANTVFSSDIVNGEVKIADIGPGAVATSEVLDDTATGGGLTAADLRSGSVGPAEAAGLGSDDIANASGGSDDINANKLDGINSSGFVQGRGKVLAGRFILPATPGIQTRTLLEIPNLGRVDARCDIDGGDLSFINTTNFDIDFWREVLGNPSHEVIHPGGGASLASSNGIEASTFAVGFGDDPGPRRMATVHAFASQADAVDPCIFQAQGLLWTNE
jgi:hypothetical protein